MVALFFAVSFVARCVRLIQLRCDISMICVRDPVLMLWFQACGELIVMCERSLFGVGSLVGSMRIGVLMQMGR